MFREPGEVSPEPERVRLSHNDRLASLERARGRLVTPPQIRHPDITPRAAGELSSRASIPIRIRRLDRAHPAPARVDQSKVVYMNAPLCAGLSSLRKTGWAAALHSALLQPDSLRAPMKSADSRLIHLASWSGSDNFSGLVSPRSYLSCHHARMPPQLLTFHPFSSTFRQTREIRPV